MKAGFGLREEFCKDFDGIYSNSTISNNNNSNDKNNNSNEEVCNFLFTTPPDLNGEAAKDGNDIVQLFKSELLDSLDHALQMLRHYVQDPYARREAFAQLLSLLEITSSNVKQILGSMMDQSASSLLIMKQETLSSISSSNKDSGKKMAEGDIAQSLIIDDLAKISLGNDEPVSKEKFVFNPESSMLLLGITSSVDNDKTGLFIKSSLDEKKINETEEQLQAGGLFIKSGESLEDWIVANNE